MGSVLRPFARSPRAATTRRWCAGFAALLLGASLGIANVDSDDAQDPHVDLFAQEQYPSARQCAACHTQIFEEWSSSAHAYAAISPMFHRFEQRINDLASGTIGTFCVRCHIPVGSALSETRETQLWDRAPVSTEGVTCIACHRVEEKYGRVNGERRIVPGTIFEPIYGSQGGPELDNVLADPDEYGVDPDGTRPGNTPIHGSAHKFSQITKSAFCASCHQVAVHPGIKLEVVWEQYRDSPARQEDISCQDCHMGVNPGTNEGGYAFGPRAVVNGRPINPGSKHTDHGFTGPGYSIAHPGIFPHHLAATDFTIKDWMTFDWRAGWGSDDFEDALDESFEFPDAWTAPERRRQARVIVDENLDKLGERAAKRQSVMEEGSRIDGPYFDGEARMGQDLAFHYDVTNLCKGHNLPSGSLGAQPEIWLNVALTGPGGNTVWESGYVDSHGDMADLHSQDVRAGTLPHDDQLFNLQTKFLTTNLKGTDREMYLPVPFDQDQLPFIRPAATPNSVMNHPPFIRMEQRSIPPLSTRAAEYKVPGELLTEPGTYRLAVRLRSRAEPIYFMEFVKATQEMIREMNRRMISIHPYTVEFEVR